MVARRSQRGPGFPPCVLGARCGPLPPSPPSRLARMSHLPQKGESFLEGLGLAVRGQCHDAASADETGSWSGGKEGAGATAVPGSSGGAGPPLSWLALPAALVAYVPVPGSVGCSTLHPWPLSSVVQGRPVPGPAPAGGSLKSPPRTPVPGSAGCSTLTRGGSSRQRLVIPARRHPGQSGSVSGANSPCRQPPCTQCSHSSVGQGRPVKDPVLPGGSM